MTFFKIKNVIFEYKTDLSDKHVTSDAADWNNRVLSDKVIIKEGIRREIVRVSQSVRDVRSRSMLFVFYKKKKYFFVPNMVLIYFIRYITLSSA